MGMKTISKENLARFFAQYLGAIIHDDFYTEDYSNKLISVEIDKEFDNCWVNSDNSTLNSRHLEDITIKLKSLSAITDEDVIQLCRVIYELPFRGQNPRFFEIIRNIKKNEMIAVINKYNDYSYAIWEDGSKCVLYRDGEIDISGNEIGAADFLRQKQYALPFTCIEEGKVTTYSVEDLVEMGLIKFS